MGNACSCISKNKEKRDNAKAPKKKGKDEILAEKAGTAQSSPEPKELPLLPEAPEGFETKHVESVGADVIPSASEYPSPALKPKEKSLDEYAASLGNFRLPSFKALIYALVYNRPAKKNDSVKSFKKEEDKVRAIFTWLTTINVQKLEFCPKAEAVADTPEAVLVGLSKGRVTYAQAFQMLCRHAGLQCKLIRGYAKGIDYKPGMKLEGGQEALHAWNAVMIDGKWQIFDCHWAARRLTGKSHSLGDISHDLDLFYYMANPYHLRYTHMPNEQDWQLASPQITLRDFEDLTLVKPTFFKFGLELFSHKQAVIYTKGQLVVKILCPKESIDDLCFTFTLSAEGLGKIHEGPPLSRYGMQNLSTDPCCAIFTFRFPKAGAYKLLLFARRSGDQVYGGVCEYKIMAEIPDAVKENSDDKATQIAERMKVVPFPPTQQSSYGKTEMTKQYHIISSNTDPSVIRCASGTGEVSFKSSDAAVKMPRLMARLRGSFATDQVLSKRLLLRNVHEGTPSEFALITFYLPTAGEYALELYANNPEQEGSSFFLVWQYLVISEGGTDLPTGIPNLSTGMAIGAQQQFSEYGLQTKSHSDPFISVKNSDVSGQCDLIIKVGLPGDAPEKAVRVLGQLLDVSNEDDEVDCGEYLLQQMPPNQNDHVDFWLRFPKGGCFYKLHVFASPLKEKSETVPMVFTYLIEAPRRLSSGDVPYIGSQKGPFPAQLAPWKEHCALVSPIDRKILVNKDEAGENASVDFLLQIPKVSAVAVVAGSDNWIQLKKKDSHTCTWEGCVSIPTSLENHTKIPVCACFTEKITSYTTMLEYSLVFS